VNNDELNQLIEGYELMRAALNYAADKSITINNMDKALAVPIPEIVLKYRQEIPNYQTDGLLADLLREPK
jgi:hypothetical protein